MTSISVELIGAGYMTTGHIRVFSNLQDMMIPENFSRFFYHATSLSTPHGVIVPTPVANIFGICG